ncbi:MAG: serine/threonine-protein kinase [Planctomycetota bacterium]
MKVRFPVSNLLVEHARLDRDDARTSSGPRSRILSTPVGLRRASTHPEYLLEDWTLQGCGTVPFEGEDRPAIGGIPLLAKLGRGGMGYVYCGLHPELGFEVAVKVLPRSMEEEHQSAVERFLREGRLAATLDSPHVVRVLDVGRDAEARVHYLVMECVVGRTAGQWVEKLNAEGAVGAPEPLVLDVGLAAAAGLAAAHEIGVIHRDIKPDNILIPDDDAGEPVCAEAKVTDLGLARLSDDTLDLTRTATALGTAGYIAPEQLKNAKAASTQADVFSLGATLYGLLTGDAPFAAESSVLAILNTINGQFQSLRERRADVSPAFADLIERCLAPEAESRFTDGAALEAALRALRDG